jgi:putative ABC transport system substrate-binding protein
MSYRGADAESLERVSAFRTSLGATGLVEGRDYQLDVHFFAGDRERARRLAAEIVGQQVDVIVVNGSPGVRAVSAVTTTIPVVFVVVVDPVGQGFVSSMARPGGHVTGFSTFEPEIAGKWLELLRAAYPRLERVGILNDPGFFPALAQTVERLAAPLGLEAVTIHVQSQAGLAGDLTTFARRPNAGLVVTPAPVNSVNRERIFAICVEHRLPAIWPFAFHARDGALMAYGFDPVDLFRRAGPYVARILRGEKPGELPVQAPTRFELVVNLRTARAMGLEIPEAFLLRADELID